MLYVTYIDVENENETYVQIDMNVRYDLPFKEDKWIDENFKEIVRKAIDTKKKVIFTVNHPENNGLTLHVIKYYLRESGQRKVFIKPSEEWVGEVFEIALGAFVEVILL